MGFQGFNTDNGSECETEARCRHFCGVGQGSSRPSRTEGKTINSLTQANQPKLCVAFCHFILKIHILTLNRTWTFIFANNMANQWTMQICFLFTAVAMMEHKLACRCYVMTSHEYLLYDALSASPKSNL